jgi:hypothetical protein
MGEGEKGGLNHFRESLSDLNLAPLEEGATFRSDELYFIRLAGGYIRSIFCSTSHITPMSKVKTLLTSGVNLGSRSVVIIYL